MGSNLAAPILGAAREHAGRPALKLADSTTTYAELDDGSARVAGMLRGMGVGAGDRVAVMLPNVPEFALAYYGALRLGAIVVPMNPLLKTREVRFYLDDAGADVIFALEGLHEHAEAGAREAGARCVVVPFELGPDRVDDIAPAGDEDTAVILYTSGTTGTPKGAELSHRSLRRNFEISAGLFDVHPDDVALGALPLFHSFGQTCTLNATLSAGACLTLLPRFDPGQALELIEQHGVSICAGVPTMYSAMLGHARLAETDVSRLHVCISGGSAMPVDVLRRSEEAFGCPMLEGYGLTESSPVASFNHPDRPHKPGSIGTPIEGVEMRVVDDDDRDVPAGEMGEIVIRGHNVMKGYWRAPDATAHTMRGGWLHTGDLAKVDEDGYYFIVDRKKDLIIRGGLNVYPREVEEILHEHPAVREAAVVAVPHELLGQDVGAAVVLNDGADADERALRSYVREQIAAYKYPRKVWFVDELPKGPTEKVLKREIRVPDA